MISDLRKVFAKLIDERVVDSQQAVDRAIMGSEPQRAALHLGRRQAFEECVALLKEAIEKVDAEDDDDDDDDDTDEQST